MAEAGNAMEVGEFLWRYVLLVIKSAKCHKSD